MGTAEPVDQQHVARIALQDFRCFESLELELGSGITVVLGNNGQGKTSLLEAVGWPARAGSLRNVNDAAVVRSGAAAAIIRSEIVQGDRVQSFEAEVRAAGRNRMLVNRQPVARVRDLHGLLRVTVFAPDDLQLVKGSPSLRRDFVDDLLDCLAPRYAAALHDYERILRQRNALLKSIARDRSGLATLPAFDEQLVAAATEIVRGRIRLLERLEPKVRELYQALGEGATISLGYRAEWLEDQQLCGDELDGLPDLLRAALTRRRQQELDRQVGLVGPHRDDLVVRLNELDARTQSSQGEQRSLALALRLAGHAVVTDVAGAAPVLLLDDVFSELDTHRCAALVALLPAGQTLLSTATEVPEGIDIEQFVDVDSGKALRR